MNEATTTSTTQAIGPDIPDTGMCIGAEATGTMSQHHTPISQPLPLVSLEPVRYERLMLYFTDKDFANNNMTADVRPKETHITTTLTSLPAVPQKAYYRRCGVEQTSQLLPPSAPPTLWGDSVQEGGGHPGGNGIQVRGGQLVGGSVAEDRLEERGRPVEGDQHGSNNLGMSRGGRSQGEGIEGGMTR